MVTDDSGHPPTSRPPSRCEIDTFNRIWLRHLVSAVKTGQFESTLRAIRLGEFPGVSGAIFIHSLAERRLRQIAVGTLSPDGFWNWYERQMEQEAIELVRRSPNPNMNPHKGASAA